MSAIRAGWLAAAGVVLAASAATAQDATRGKAVYEKWCLECHGEAGEGNGQAAKFMLPPPRDFTKGVYKIRTTASGELPTDDDLMYVVSEGMPGSAMPEWKSKLSDTDRKDVIAYIKKFSAFFGQGQPPKALALGKAPSSSAANLEDGRKTFDKLQCAKCHGTQGRGEGKSSPTLKDDYGFAIRAADLSHSWNFRGGSTVEQIYHRLRTGLDGTPMPSFSDALDQKLVTEEQLWHVAQYVRSLSPEQSPPDVKEVIRAQPSTGKLPASPTDSAWAHVDRQWVPLVGQIIQKPRWFMPSVDGVWVQAVHDDKTLVMKLSWDDRSQSPNPVWDDWLGRVMKGASDVDGALPTKQGPDRFWVQFPKRIPGLDDTERPYFLGGSSQKPVYLWRWASSPDASEEGTGSGLGQFTARAGTADVTHAAVWDQGQWQLQFSRSLIPSDTTVAPAFGLGRPIPIAFFASDGSNGETELRGSVSAWYAIYLDVPTPPTVYVTPVVAVLLTAGLCMMVVWRAQQRTGRPADKPFGRNS